jgi:hypothetical protein
MMYREVLLHDFSMIGACAELQIGNGLLVGGYSRLRILGPNGRQLIEVESSVAHCMSHKRVGLKFLNAGPGIAKALHNLIERDAEIRSRRGHETCILLGAYEEPGKVKDYLRKRTRRN